MLTLKQIRELRQDESTDKAALFETVFTQWVTLQDKLTVGEDAAYRNEGWIFRDLLGLSKVNEIMDKVTSKE